MVPMSFSSQSWRLASNAKTRLLVPTMKDRVLGSRANTPLNLLCESGLLYHPEPSQDGISVAMDQAHLPIAIVEDERILREELAFQLTHLGFAVETFETAAQLYRRLAVRRYAVVVLDIALEDEDGLSICRYLRRHDKQLGLVFITARATRDDRLIGLQAGGDAYLTKPVDIDELALLLRRLAERAIDTLGWTAPPPGPSQAPSDWRMDPGGDVLLAPDGARIRLSLNEARLLQGLLRRPGEVVTSQELARALGLLPDEYDKHRIEVIISRLRDKVLRETGRTLPLYARRGQGYRFVPSD